MKARLRFNKMGSMMYIGHLDLMRYFQKLFRRCGLDVSYSKGFNPHQIMSFASPLGLGLTSIGEYLDLSLESFDYNGFDSEKSGKASYTADKWIDIINANSNGLVNVTGFRIMPDDIKPSMSLLSAATYRVEFEQTDIPGQIYDFFNENDELIYTKETKKSKKDIDLKANIPVIETSYELFAREMSSCAVFDYEYEKQYINDDMGCLYIMCTAGSALNIKPEMLIDAFCTQKGLGNIHYNIMRMDMYTYQNKYISMSVK